jgi:hypothetical protein
MQSKTQTHRITSYQSEREELLKTKLNVFCNCTTDQNVHRCRYQLNEGQHCNRGLLSYITSEFNT